MRNNAIMRSIIKIIPLFICLNTNAYEVKPHLTKTFSFIDTPSINKYETLGKPSDQLKDLSVGLSYFYNNYTTSITTNRIYNKSVDRGIIINGVNYINNSKATIDTFSIGYIKNRFKSSLLLSNAKIHTKTLANNKIQAETKKNAIMVGSDFCYFLKKDILINMFYFGRNKELNIKKVIGIGFTKLF